MALRLLFEEADSYMKAIPLLFASIVLCCYFAPAPARADSETILSVSESGGSSVGGMPFALPDYPNFIGFSFTLDRAFRDLSVTAEDMHLVSVPGSTAWLTNSIGPNATAANVIATTSFSYENPQNPFVGPITFFAHDDVDLAGGTYYFFISSIPPQTFSYGYWGGSGDLGPVIAAPGVGGFETLFTAGPSIVDYQFPPASNWSALGLTLGPIVPFEIHASPVPEPSSLVLFCTGVLALCGLRLRKTRPTLS